MNLKVNEFLNSAGIAYSKTNQRDKAKRELDYHILKIKNTSAYKKGEIIDGLKPKVYDLLDKERKIVIDKKSKKHISELETEIILLKKELGKYKEKNKLVALKKELQEERIILKEKRDKLSKTKIKVVKIDKEEVKKLQLQIIRLEKICELLERQKKSKKLEVMKIKLKKIEKKLKTIKLLK